MNREILRLAVPNIISNLSVPLLSFVDVALMGHLESPEYILTIGFGVMIFNFIYWSFGFLRMGTVGFTAQEYGKGDNRECLLLLGRALLVAVTGALLLIGLKNPLLNVSLLFIDTTPEVKTYVAEYFSIRILAAPATISLFAFTGWFFGMQNAKYPMILAMSVNLLNILFSFCFVRFYGMKSNGVAMGTLLAQYCGLMLAFVLFYTRYKNLLFFWKGSHLLETDKIKQFLSVNSDIIIRTLCLLFVFSFFKVQSAKEGVVLGSANIVLLELFMIIAFGIDGFANAAESIVGKYFGAGDKKNFRDAIIRSFQWGTGLSILLVSIFFLFGRELLATITDNQEIIDSAIPFLWWIIFSPIINFIPFIWDGIYIGITASKAMRNSMLMSTFFFFLPAYYLFHAILGNHALWLALTLFMLARGISQTVLAKGAVFNKLKQYPAHR